jgi:hypothetical protein
MKTWSKLAVAAAFIALSAPAMAQQPPASTQAAPSAAAIGYAKEILALKNAAAMYASAVPNVIQRTKDLLIQTNLNFQKDLNEIAPTIAKAQNGREREIGDLMARVYAADFTEQELKDLVVFYKTPLGQKLLTQEPKAIQNSLNAINQWAQSFAEQVDKMFRDEMKKRGKDLS